MTAPTPERLMEAAYVAGWRARSSGSEVAAERAAARWARHAPERELHDRVIAVLTEDMTVGDVERMSGLLRVIYVRYIKSLRSVAERHAPYGPDAPGCCGHCNEQGGEYPDSWGMSPWPCPDFRSVAAAVGVEVPDAV